MSDMPARSRTSPASRTLSLALSRSTSGVLVLGVFGLAGNLEPMFSPFQLQAHSVVNCPHP
jgi:hypothetical protein